MMFNKVKNILSAVVRDLLKNPTWQDLHKTNCDGKLKQCDAGQREAGHCDSSLLTAPTLFATVMIVRKVGSTTF